MASASTLSLRLADLNSAPRDSTLALLFPGQGSQEVGAGQDLFQTAPAARSVFEKADAVLGFPLSELCFRGPEPELLQTVNAQPAILVTSLACLAAALESGALRRRPALLAGHSLGEYTALVAAGALDFEAALSLVRRRADLMQEAAQRAPGVMAALVGLDEEKVEDVCRRSGAEPCNYNSPGQTVIGGTPRAVEQAAAMARELGGRALPLSVSGAFHTSLIRSAAEAFAAVVDACPLRDPAVPVVANATADVLTTAEAVRTELKQQMLRPVLWRQSMARMVQSGVTTFVEVGPGHVLTSLVKRAEPGLTAISVSDASSLDALRDV